MGLWAFDFSVGKALQVELFNGEIGYVEPHNFDRADLKKVFAGYSKKRLKRFQVKFARKEKICVNYGREIPTATRGKFTSESVENNLELAYAISIHKRSEEHTSELQSLMRISYAVFCLKKT